jgi:hypothetical protein
MRVKDLKKFLENVDDDVIVSHMDYFELSPEYYDGLCLEVTPGSKHPDLGTTISFSREIRKSKLVFKYYGMNEYMSNAAVEGVPFEEAFNLIEFKNGTESYKEEYKEIAEKYYERMFKILHMHDHVIT